jgi:flagellar hook protein FlgE
MSLLNTMYTGVSGLDAESNALSVIGNNVANTNTVGFKESRAIFESVMGTTSPSPDAVGSGVDMTSTQQLFTEGSIQNTGVSTDLALSGDGFFVVNGSAAGTQGNFYTRAGQMNLNAQGTLVNTDGLQLQGYSQLPSGQLSTQLSSITLQTASLPPQATTTMNVTANLDANATPPTLAWDAQNPAATSNFSTSLTAYDSLGNSHVVNVYFQNTGAGQWTYHELANGSEVTGGTAGQNFEFGTGTITFNTAGALQSVTPTGGAVTFNGANAQNIALNLGTPIASGGTGLNGTTQFGNPSDVTSQSQDGYASGDLSGVQIDQSGDVSGVYTNGQTIKVAQIAVAKFQDNDGLSNVGQNLWSSTVASGDPALGAAGTGGRGAIDSGALEQSNVDISSQFVDLIAHQQGFQANSKTIQTANQMLSDLMQLQT